MTLMSDLTRDLVEEILSRVPITSLRAVRSTCKQWNALSKKRIFGTVEARKQFLGFMMMNYKVWSVRFDFHGFQKDKEEFVDPSIKQTGKFNQVEISKVFHCDGLLLCITRDKTRLVVWNPYLGQTRWIEPRIAYHRSDRYALGYDNNNGGRRNHKILWFTDRYDYSVEQRIVEYEIFDLNSNSWKGLKVYPWQGVAYNYYQDVSLKGNSYIIADRDIVDFDQHCFLICFDFTRESFGQLLELPFTIDEVAALSSLRDEKLAILYHDWKTIQIWVSTKIEPNAVSWSNLLKFDTAPLNRFLLMSEVGAGSFFIDEKKIIVVVFDFEESEMTETGRYNTVYIIGENGILKKVNLGGALKSQEPMGYGEPPYYLPLVCSSSYVPSLVQINQIGESKKRKRKRKSKQTNKV